MIVPPRLAGAWSGSAVDLAYMPSGATGDACVPASPEPPCATDSRIGQECPACKRREPCPPCCLARFDMAMTSGRIYARKPVKSLRSLYRAGARFDCLFGIRTGFFKSTVVLEDGREQVIGFHMAGDFLGMDGIDTERHASQAIALEDSEVYIMPFARLQDPGLQCQLYKVMSRELVREQGMMTLLGMMGSAERLAAFLLDLSRRFVARGLSSRELHLRMTRRDIGSYLGISFETVSRLLSRFEQDRLVHVEGRRIHIRDIDALRALLGDADGAAR